MTWLHFLDYPLESLSHAEIPEVPVVPVKGDRNQLSTITQNANGGKGNRL